MTNLPSHFATGRQHLQGFRKIRLALGLHPLHAPRHKAEYELFDKYLALTSYVGEVGLDFSWEGIVTKLQQIQSFEFVLNRIQGQNKLLSIHSRGAEQEVLEMLVKYSVQLAIFHWYTGPISILKNISDHGYYFSVNPAMIRSEKGRQVIANIPKEKLLTETDGPFVQIGNKIAEPADVESVVTYLAECWGMPSQGVFFQIQSNFARLINGLKSH